MRRRDRGRGRQRTSKGEAGKAILAISLVLAGISILGVFTYLNITTPKPPELDRETGCPTMGPNGAMFVVIDTTDKLPDPAQTQVVTLLDQVAQKAPKYSLT